MRQRISALLCNPLNLEPLNDLNVFVMKLYNVAYSGNSYKVRLLLAQLGIPCEIVEVDILRGESRTARVSQDQSQRPHAGARRQWIYLGRIQRHPRLPCPWHEISPRRSQEDSAQVFQWMFFEQYSHEPFIATSRFWLQHKPDTAGSAPRCSHPNATAAGPRSKSWKNIWQRTTSSSATIPSPTSRCSPIPCRG